MAVINCGECGGKVSTTARACPHCGAIPTRFSKAESKPRSPFFYIALVIFILFIIGSLNKQGKESQSIEEVGGVSGGNAISKKESAVKDVEAAKSKVVQSTGDKIKVCKAAISHMMGRSTQSMSSSSKSELVYVDYIRPDDKQKFEYACDIKGQDIVWATKIDGRWGRWRNHPDDPKFSYKLIADELIIFEDAGRDIVEKKFVFSKI